MVPVTFGSYYDVCYGKDDVQMTSQESWLVKLIS